MATRAKFARLAQYSREFGEASHIFFKNGLWQMSVSLVSPGKVVGECRRVWRVLAKLLANISEFGESQNKSKKRIFGEYSHSLNLLNLQHSPNYGKLIILFFVCSVYATNKCRNLWKDFTLTFLSFPWASLTTFHRYLSTFKMLKIIK